MKVFINQEEDKYDWHEWFKETLDEEEIDYSFKDEDSDIEEEKADADFILYFASPDSENIDFASKLTEDIDKNPHKLIFYILEEDEYEKDTLASLKVLEDRVDEVGGKVVDATAHAINYIHYIDREGFDHIPKANLEILEGELDDLDETEKELLGESITNISITDEFERHSNLLKSWIDEPQLIDDLKDELKKSADFIREDELKDHLKENVRPIAEKILEKRKEMEANKSATRKDIEKIAGSLIGIIVLGLALFASAGILTTGILVASIVTVLRIVFFTLKTPIRLTTYVIRQVKRSLAIITNDTDSDVKDKREELNNLRNNLDDVLKSEEPKLYQESPSYSNNVNVDKMASSDVYSHLNRILRLENKVNKFLNDAREVTGLNAEIDFKRFDKFRHVFKERIDQYLDEGKIKLLYNEDSSLSRSLMFLPMFKSEDEFILYINVTSLAKEDEIVVDGQKDYEYEFHHHNNLINALIAGYALINVAKKPNLVSHNHKVKRAFFDMYSEMMISTINRIGSISNDPDNAKVVKYVLAKFMYLNIFDRKMNDTLEESCKVLSETEGVEKVDVINMKFDEDDYQTVGGMLNILSESFPQLDLDVPGFIKIHTILFGEGTLLCIDYMPYMVGLAFSERFNFALYTSSKNIKKTLKLPANRLQTTLIDKIK